VAQQPPLCSGGSASRFAGFDQRRHTGQPGRYSCHEPNAKRVKAPYDAKDESSNKQQEKKGIDKLNPF